VGGDGGHQPGLGGREQRVLTTQIITSWRGVGGWVRTRCRAREREGGEKRTRLFAWWCAAAFACKTSSRQPGTYDVPIPRRCGPAARGCTTACPAREPGAPGQTEAWRPRPPPSRPLLLRPPPRPPRR
jgi:hypothetical protein